MNGAKLVATHKSRYFERKDGLALGPGAFVQALEYASGKEAVVVGKPSPTFYQSVMKDFSCSPNEMVMIGDVRDTTVEPVWALGNTYHTIARNIGSHLIWQFGSKPCI